MNVGAVVVHPDLEYFDFEVYAPKTSLSKLDKTYEPRQIDNFADIFAEQTTEYCEMLAKAGSTDEIESILKEIERLHSGEGFQLSSFKWADFDVDDPDPVHLDYFLNDLVEQYVKPITGRKKQDRKKLTLKQRFREDLKSHGLLARGGQPGIEPKFRPRSAGAYEYDYGYRNGQYYLFETVDLSDYEEESGAVLREAGETLMKFIEAGRIEESEGVGVQRYTLVKSNVDIDKFRTIQNLAEQSKVFDYGDQVQRLQFLNEIESEIRGSQLHAPA